MRQEPLELSTSLTLCIVEGDGYKRKIQVAFGIKDFNISNPTLFRSFPIKFSKFRKRVSTLGLGHGALRRPQLRQLVAAAVHLLPLLLCDLAIASAQSGPPRPPHPGDPQLHHHQPPTSIKPRDIHIFNHLYHSDNLSVMSEGKAISSLIDICCS